MLGEYLTGALSARPPILFRQFGRRRGGLRCRLRRGGRGLRRLRACHVGLHCDRGVKAANDTASDFCRIKLAISRSNHFAGCGMFFVPTSLNLNFTNSRRISRHFFKSAVKKRHLVFGCAIRVRVLLCLFRIIPVASWAYLFRLIKLLSSSSSSILTICNA